MLFGIEISLSIVAFVFFLIGLFFIILSLRDGAVSPSNGWIDYLSNDQYIKSGERTQERGKRSTLLSWSMLVGLGLILLAVLFFVIDQ